MRYTYTFSDGRRIEDSSVLGLLSQGVPRRLSVEGLWSYLLSGAVQEPFTLIDGVKSVAEPFDLKREIAEFDEKKVINTIETAVRKSCSRDSGLPSAFLSGGIDSSAIVAVMRRLYPQEEIRTYCVIHEDPRTDERQWARMVAERNHTRHTEFLLTDDMIRREIAAALDCYDQPSVDGLNNYFASKFVAEAGEKCILSGEGGDEVFAGYGQYEKARQAYRIAAKMRIIPSNLRGFSGRMLTRLASAEKWKKLGQLMSADYDPYFVTRRQFDPEWIVHLLNGAFAQPKLADLFGEIQRHCGTQGIDFGGDIVNRCAWMEQRHNLRSMYWRDGIQTSAPFGLEILAPLMDEELVTLMMTIAGKYKCNASISKPLLVAAAGEGLPMECVKRKKQGFALPFDRYFREGLKEQLEHFVFKGGTGLFNQPEIERIWKLYLAGKTSWMRVWQPFVLDWWIRKNKVELF